MDEKPNLAISGIRTGENIGKRELTTSGTMGTASLQVFRGDIKFEDGHVNIDYAFAKKYLIK